MLDRGNQNLHWKIFIPVLIVIFLAVFSAFSLILLLINKSILIDTKHVNLLDMYIRSSFVLLGSTLSGIIAIFIFSLQERSKRIEKDQKEIMYHLNIKEELDFNYKVIGKISKLMVESSIEELATDIKESKEVKEILLVIFTQLNFSFYEDFIKEINQKEFEDSKKAAHICYQIYKYLDVVINKLDDVENIATILRLIKSDTSELKDIYLRIEK